MTSRTAAEVIAGHDLTGKETIVTGGYGGLGYEIAKALAGAGARVVLAGRDPAKGEAAVGRLRTATGNDKVVFRAVDLASLESVTTWARRHAETGKPLHILVNNAAVMATPLSRTVDGFESQFATNHLGHFAFTVGLLPCLRAAGNARVVSLTSSAHRRSDIDFDDPNYEHRPYDPWQAYGQSKTANALFAVGFAAHHADDGVTVNAVMPGGIRTGLQRHLSDDDLRKRGWTGSVPGWKTPEQGAATPVWAAVASEVDGVSGKYIEDCAIATAWSRGDSPPPGHYLPYALDPANAERLWELSRKLIGQR
jgi:NAD(P)-dependent dehydrogenase (short-subunit alcohol dehydrogenase family)